jgi:hypothetical protein
MKVEIENDHIAIYEEDIEIVYWHVDEWMEDFEIVPSIAHAILLSQTNPEELKRRLKIFKV